MQVLAAGHPVLTFGVISDLHIRVGSDDLGRRRYEDKQAEQRFAMALQDLHQIDPNQKVLVINGDLTETGLQSDYDHMKKVLRLNPHAANTWFTIGNHEFYAAFRDKHGKLNMKAFPNERTETRCIQRFLWNTGAPNVYYDKWIEGYHFVMLGSEKSRISNPDYGDNAWVSDAQLNWLEARLKGSSPDKPVFVFLHQPLSQTFNGSLRGFVMNYERLKMILSKYPQVLIFSGHTHRSLHEHTGNKFHDAFTMVNVSSVRRDGEGLFVVVEGNKVVVRGRDFIHKAWINKYTIPFGHSVVSQDTA